MNTGLDGLLIGHGRMARMTWKKAAKHLAGLRATWSDFEGFHLEILPTAEEWEEWFPEAPFASHLWAWSDWSHDSDGRVYRVRLERGWATIGDERGWATIGELQLCSQTSDPGKKTEGSVRKVTVDRTRVTCSKPRNLDKQERNQTELDWSSEWEALIVRDNPGVVFFRMDERQHGR